MGAVLGWDAATRAREVEHYLARVEAERQSQLMPDDATADAARLGAPDVRGFAADRGVDGVERWPRRTPDVAPADRSRRRHPSIAGRRWAVPPAGGGPVGRFRTAPTVG